MATNEPAQWSMNVVLVCQVTPPGEVLRKAVDETCGSDCAIAADEGRRVVTVEADAADAAQAVAALQAKAQRLVDRLSDFDCAIELTSRLEDRSAPVEPPQAGSLGER
jgi:phosphotransferase system HPr-like phosphotransfer protein